MKNLFTFGSAILAALVVYMVGVYLRSIGLLVPDFLIGFVAGIGFLTIIEHADN